MFSALCIEVVYLEVVQQQLQGVSDSAAHAASLKMDGTSQGLVEARQAALRITDGMMVNYRPYALRGQDVIFGHYDVDEEQFTPTEDPALANSVRVPLTEPDVGLGFGMAFFQKVFPVSVCSAVMQGPGNANTGDIGGSGLNNGHFDYDTVDARRSCPGDQICDGTAKHTHEYDDDYDVTGANVFDDLGGHLPVDGCTQDGGGKGGKGKKGKKGKGKGGKIGACGGDYSRTVPDGVPFKITVINADLSPGGWITINGEDFDVQAYDDIAFEDLPTYTLGGLGVHALHSLEVNFDVNAIANCELIPTNTGDVKANTPGILNEWRSGALTVQLVAHDAIATPGLSSGDHPVVATENDGLYWEATFFWHWDGPSYTVDDAYEWRAQYNDLDCHNAQFIDHRPGGNACN